MSWSPATEADHYKLQELLDLEEGLTEWEVDFVEAISKDRDRYQQSWTLSPKQRETLNRIWDEKCDK